MMELPNGWELSRLSEIAEINPRLPIGEIKDDMEVTFLPMKLVEEVSNTIHLIDFKKYSEVKKGFTPMTDGDVIFAKITPCMENGKIAVVHSLKNRIGFGSTEFHVFRCGKAVTNFFLFYYLVQAQFRQDAQHKMTGAVGQKRVPKKYLEDHTIPLPPLAEQHRIVAKIEELFSSLEKGIESLKIAQAQLKTYRQAVLKWAFEGKLTNENVKDGELPEGWKWEKLGDISEKIQIGPFGSQLHKEDYIENGIPLINPMHINGGKIIPDVSYTIREEKKDSLPNYILQTDDIILGRRGEMGRAGLIQEKENGWFCGTGSLFVRPNKKLLNSKYLHLLLGGAEVKKYLENNAAGTTMANLNKKIIHEIPLLLPPLPEQSRIVAEIETRLSVCDKLEESITQSLLQAEALRQSILKKAFEGKLVPQDPSDEPASVLLERIRAERAAVVAKKPATARKRKRT